MKTILFYGRRNTGLVVLMYLTTGWYDLKVVSDDENILWYARERGLTITTLEDKDYDLFICCHGQKILPKELIQEGKMINIHPVLELFRGHAPIRKFIKGKHTNGSVSVLKLIEEVDMGETIHTEYFETPECERESDFYNVALPFYVKAISKALDILNV